MDERVKISETAFEDLEKRKEELLKDMDRLDIILRLHEKMARVSAFNWVMSSQCMKEMSLILANTQHDLRKNIRNWIGGDVNKTIMNTALYS